MDEIFRNSLPELEALTGVKIDVEAYERHLAAHEGEDDGFSDLTKEEKTEQLHRGLQTLERVYGSAVWVWLEHLLTAWKAADAQAQRESEGK